MTENNTRPYSLRLSDFSGTERVPDKTGISDADRASALETALCKAELHCKIGDPLVCLHERVSEILRIANSMQLRGAAGPLDPRLYELGWWVRDAIRRQGPSLGHEMV
jgi:hypothetical protein